MPGRNEGDPSKGTGWGPGEGSTRRFVGSMDNIDRQVGDRSVGYTMSDSGVTKTVRENSSKVAKSGCLLVSGLLGGAGLAVALLGAKYGIST